MPHASASQAHRPLGSREEANPAGTSLNPEVKGPPLPPMALTSKPPRETPPTENTKQNKTIAYCTQGTELVPPNLRNYAARLVLVSLFWS